MLFIKPELFRLAESSDIDDLRRAVQSAIELEHSTMPPYLYALYSLGDANVDVADVLSSIVKEEMLHMLLACNILNAIGGRPKINDPSFVPTYPTPLPGTIDIGIKVPLKPFSQAVARDVFMKIEEPEHPLHFRTTAALLGFDQPPRTIGQFYARIKEQIRSLEVEAAARQRTIFSGDPARQVTSFGLGVPPARQKVTSAESAAAAIELIVEQGEGTERSPKFGASEEYAHYYRFAELAGGKRLVPNPNAKPDDPPDRQYEYGPVPVNFDPGAVLPLVKNPKTAEYAASVQPISANCNRAYTNVLRFLDEAFNGNASVMGAARQAMHDLADTARKLTELTIDGGHLRAGPTFEYLP